MVTYEKLLTVNAESAADITKLTKQLSQHAEECTQEYLKEIISDADDEVWVARDGKHIVAMGCLVIVRVPEKLKGRIEDVVVDVGYRRQGIGLEITKKLLERAKEKKIKVLELNSSGKREDANRMYKKLFDLHETNVYRHIFTA